MRKFLAAWRHPGGWLRDICGGEASFPLVVLFGLNAVDELDRTAFGILLPNIRDEFHLDNTKVLGLVALVSVAALAVAGADRPIRRPVTARAAGHPRRGRVGVVQRAHRSGNGCDRADHRPQRQRGRQGGDRPDAQLADRRLLPDQLAQQGVQHPPRRQRGRIVRRPVVGRAAGIRVRLARPVPGLRDPDDGLRRHCPAIARTRSRPMGATGDGRQRRGHRHRGNGAVVCRELANGAEDREPQAHLVEPAIPRHRADRVRGVGLAAVRAGVRPRRTRPRVRLGHCRTVPARWLGARLAHRHPTLPRQHARLDSLPRQGRNRHVDRRDRVRPRPEHRRRGSVSTV